MIGMPELPQSLRLATTLFENMTLTFATCAGNYTYQGCFNDSVATRVLTSAGLYGSNSNNMTLDKCATYCSKYAYFGVEYGQE